MTGVITVRQAQAEDVLPIAWIERAAFPDPWPPDLLIHEVGHPAAFVLVAMDSEVPVGYASFHNVGDEAELLRLAVLPEHRRRGIAKQLLEHGFTRLRAGAVASCFLEVREDNDGAIHLYREQGFEYSGRRRAYYRDGSDALVLVRRV